MELEAARLRYARQKSLITVPYLRQKTPTALLYTYTSGMFAKRALWPLQKSPIRLERETILTCDIKEPY